MTVMAGRTSAARAAATLPRDLPDVDEVEGEGAHGGSWLVERDARHDRAARLRSACSSVTPAAVVM
jgi:hypothetical protein